MDGEQRNEFKKLFSKFSKQFECNNMDINEYKRISFRCGNESECGVKLCENCMDGRECNRKQECAPCYTPYIGDPDTKVIVIGEAPSSSGPDVVGAFCGGRFGDIETILGIKSLNKSPIHWIRDFVKERYGSVPYFTDFVKCGVRNQKDRERLEKRFDKCYETFLLKEIKIVNPDIILVMKKSWRNKPIGRKLVNVGLPVKFLTHWSPLYGKCERDQMFAKWEAEIKEETFNITRKKMQMINVAEHKKGGGEKTGNEFIFRIGTSPEKVSAMGQKVHEGMRHTVVYDKNDRCVGVIFQHHEARDSSANGQAEIRFFDRYREEYNTWHRIVVNGTKLLYKELQDILEKQGEYRYKRNR